MKKLLFAFLSLFLLLAQDSYALKAYPASGRLAAGLAVVFTGNSSGDDWEVAVAGDGTAAQAVTIEAIDGAHHADVRLLGYGPQYVLLTGPVIVGDELAVGVGGKFRKRTASDPRVAVALKAGTISCPAFMTILDTPFNQSGLQPGDLISFGGTTWDRFPSGPRGRVLRSQGPGTGPLWSVQTRDVAIGTTPAPTRLLGTFAVLDEMSRSFVTTLGDVIEVRFSGGFRVQSGDSFDVAVYLDGSEVLGTRRTVGYTSATGALGLSLGQIDGITVTTGGLLTGLSPGAHTVEIRWRANSGVARGVGLQRRLDVVEVI